MSENEDSRIHQNSTMCGWIAQPSIKVSIVKLILFENVVDGSQQHCCDSDGSFLVTSALLMDKYRLRISMFFLDLIVAKIHLTNNGLM